MSILRVDAIRDNGSGFNDVVTFANSGGTENGQLVRAWVNFNGGGAVAIRANFNVNSITDNSTGNYTVNFSNSMSDANYVFVGTCADDNDDSVGPVAVGFKSLNSYGPAAGSRRFETTFNGTSVDSPYICVAIFR